MSALRAVAVLVSLTLFAGSALADRPPRKNAPLPPTEGRGRVLQDPHLRAPEGGVMIGAGAIAISILKPSPSPPVAAISTSSRTRTRMTRRRPSSRSGLPACTKCSGWSTTRGTATSTPFSAAGDARSRTPTGMASATSTRNLLRRLGHFRRLPRVCHRLHELRQGRKPLRLRRPLLTDSLTSEAPFRRLVPQDHPRRQGRPLCQRHPIPGRDGV